MGHRKTNRMGQKFKRIDNLDMKSKNSLPGMGKEKRERGRGRMRKDGRGRDEGKRRRDGTERKGCGAFSHFSDEHTQ